ncbi:hypothetical protein BF49_5618 [Bradyrhizobium sp.]|uniref:hypothetical protein n=1 Tax=Bradyrhizobium sp. TaxID=376 RepID=UPI0007C17E57|nr:hypothetical protein [Bradyrhizobium sp.]CUT14538.1 hypothetical protein BF49_5618 [Bradyrhizobium sp.]
MSEKMKAVGDLPPSEFDPRGRSPLDDTMFSAPIPTVDQAREDLHRAALSLEALKVIEGETPSIRRAIISMHEVFLCVGEHVEDVAAQDAADEIAAAGLAH